MAPSDPHLFVLTSHDIPSPWVCAEPSDLFLMSRHVQSDGMLVLKVVKEDSDFHFAIVSCLLAHLLSCSQLPWEPLYRKAHLARSWWSPLVKSQRGTEVHNATLWRNWILPASTEVTLELDPLSLEPWNETTALNIPEMLLCEKTWQVHPAKLQSDS